MGIACREIESAVPTILERVEPATSAHFCPTCGNRRPGGGVCERDHTLLVAIGPGSLLGTEVGNYVLVQRLGEGGMGVVYRAVQPRIGAEVAIKVLHGAPGGERFLLEAQAVNRVRHPSLIKILDTGYLADRRPYLVMELLDGMSLNDAVGVIAPPLAAHVAANVLDALAAVHCEGIVHRDLKPPNVFLAADGRVVVLDFGIAKLTDGEIVTHSSGLVGTPEYMAPEQIRARPLDGRTDVYAVGVMLYEAITGRRPFAAAATFDMLVQHLEQPPVSPREYAPNLSPQLAEVILIAMEKSPERRYQSASEMAAALRATGDATRDDLVAFVAARARTRQRIRRRPATPETIAERASAPSEATPREHAPSEHAPSEHAPSEHAEPRRSSSRPAMRETVSERAPLARDAPRRWVPVAAAGIAIATIAASVAVVVGRRQPAPTMTPVATATADAPGGDAAVRADVGESPAAVAQATCMRMSTRRRECTDVYVPALVAWRVELDVPAGAAADDRRLGRAKHVALAMKEWWDHNSDAQLAAICADDSRDPTSPHVRAGVEYERRCAALDCAAFVACIEPLERTWIAAAAVKSPPKITKATKPTTKPTDVPAVQPAIACEDVAKHGAQLVDQESRRTRGVPVSPSDAPAVYATIFDNCKQWSEPVRRCVLHAKTIADSTRCGADTFGGAE
jgi:serine/threonine protein kinase